VLATKLSSMVYGIEYPTGGVNWQVGYHKLVNLPKSDTHNYLRAM